MGLLDPRSEAEMAEMHSDEPDWYNPRDISAEESAQG